MDQQICDKEGCGRPHSAMGLCEMHYRRLQRWGSSDAVNTAHRGQCTFLGCSKPHQADGLCDTHYRQRRRQAGLVPPPKTKPACVVPSCDKPQHAKTYCVAHYRLWKRYGTPCPDTKYGKGHVDGGGYKRLWINDKMVFEHRHVMEGVLGRPLLPTEIVHHKDKNRLNNAPDNLEILTQAIHMSERHHGRPLLQTTTETHRRCPKCTEMKPKEEFGTTTRRAYCTACWNAYRERHPRIW